VPNFPGKHLPQHPLELNSSKYAIKTSRILMFLSNTKNHPNL